jgi:hypothetical protein
LRGHLRDDDAGAGVERTEDERIGLRIDDHGARGAGALFGRLARVGAGGRNVRGRVYGLRGRTIGRRRRGGGGQGRLCAEIGRARYRVDSHSRNHNCTLLVASEAFPGAVFPRLDLFSPYPFPSVAWKCSTPLGLSSYCKIH